MNKVFRWFRAIVAVLIIAVNMITLPVIVIVLALLYKIMPLSFLKKPLFSLSHQLLPDWWVAINSFAMNMANTTQWEIITKGELKRDGWYLLLSNHQSWLDIMVLQRIFLRKIPMLKFFMKQELLWTLPIGGIACYLLDFPFMKRHSKEYLKKHPEQRDIDIQTTRKSCEKFKHQPITIMNYVEGTRFTPAKHRARKSPYQNLLPPKAGGIAFVLATMDQYIKHIIDTTIVYHTDNASLWNFFSGGFDKITVNIEVIPVPDELRGDYYHDKHFRVAFQQWLNERWQQKDQLISSCRQGKKPLSNA